MVSSVMFRERFVQKLALIAFAGAAGTLARYALHGWVQRFAGKGFPWGTLAVNLLGCLAFGVVWAATARDNAMNTQLRATVLVGFMGAFTTFSTFAFETREQICAGDLLPACANVATQTVLGVVGVAVGVAIGRSMV